MKTKFLLILFILFCVAAGVYVFQNINLAELNIQGGRSKAMQQNSDSSK